MEVVGRAVQKGQHSCQKSHSMKDMRQAEEVSWVCSLQVFLVVERFKTLVISLR